MRRILRHLPALTILATLAVDPVGAQDAPPTPGVVVSMQQCHPAALEVMRGEFEEHWVPVLQAAVADGRLLSWGLMEHFWGDEYNHVVYYVTPDAMTSMQTASTLLGQVMAATPGDMMQDFGDRCVAHKDNIYTLVMSPETLAPAPAPVPQPEPAVEEATAATRLPPTAGPGGR